MKNVPKISVITPCLNGAKYLEQAIESVLAQDYPNFEHIIIDGGSTDGTVDILKKYPHLEWVSEPDKGQSDAMNKGFAMSTGDVIVYLNADDYFALGAFKAAVGALDKEAGVYFVIGELEMIDGDGKQLVGASDPRSEFHDMLRWWAFAPPFPLNPVSYFYYREVQEAVGGFNLDNNYTMDYEFLLSAVRKYEAKKISKVLGTFRYCEESKTFNSRVHIDKKFIKIKYGFSLKLWRTLPRMQRLRLALEFPYKKDFLIWKLQDYLQGARHG